MILHIDVRTLEFSVEGKRTNEDYCEARCA